MRQTRMAKGDFHISRRPSHADFNIAYSEVKVRMPNQLKTPSNKGKIKFDVSFHDGFRLYGSVTVTLTSARSTSTWTDWPCLMTWPGVSCFTSSGTTDRATAGAGNFQMTTAKSRRGMNGTKKTRVTTKLLFTRSPWYQLS